MYQTFFHVEWPCWYASVFRCWMISSLNRSHSVLIFGLLGPHILFGKNDFLIADVKPSFLLRKMRKAAKAGTKSTPTPNIIQPKTGNGKKGIKLVWIRENLDKVQLYTYIKQWMDILLFHVLDFPIEPNSRWRWSTWKLVSKKPRWISSTTTLSCVS